MRAHVPAVGEQRHGSERHAGRHLDQHHRCGDADHDVGTAFGGGAIDGVGVCMLPVDWIDSAHEVSNGGVPPHYSTFTYDATSAHAWITSRSDSR